jgi:hypothetical protein
MQALRNVRLARPLSGGHKHRGTAHAPPTVWHVATRFSAIALLSSPNSSCADASCAGDVRVGVGGFVPKATNSQNKTKTRDGDTHAATVRWPRSPGMRACRQWGCTPCPNALQQWRPPPGTSVGEGGSRNRKQSRVMLHGATGDLHGSCTQCHTHKSLRLELKSTHLLHGTEDVRLQALVPEHPDACEST